MRSALYVITVLLLACVGAVAQSGGSFTISQSVIAGGGGGPSTGGTFAVTGTVGQAVAGSNASGGTFSVQGGFWGSQLAPTAATVTMSGRVLDAFGNPLRNVVVTLNDSTGGVIVTRSNAFGYFTYEEVQSGQTYLVELSALGHQFVPQVLNVKDSLTGLEFRALP